MALHGRGNPHWMWHAVFSSWLWHSSHWSCLHCQIGKDGGGYNPNLLIFFLCDASAHVENLSPEISQILPAGFPTPRFAWRELRPQGPQGPRASEKTCHGRRQLRWPMAWMTWCDPTRRSQTYQRWLFPWLEIPKWRLYGKIMDDQKNSHFQLPCLILRGIWVGGPLFWAFGGLGWHCRCWFCCQKLYCLWLILNPKTSAEPRQTLAPVWQTADVQKRSGGDGAAWLEMSLRSRLGRRVASGGWDHISLGSPLMVSLRSFAKGVQADDMKSMWNSGTSLEFFCG